MSPVSAAMAAPSAASALSSSGSPCTCDLILIELTLSKVIIPRNNATKYYFAFIFY
jgi:hypothetical protein